MAEESVFTFRARLEAEKGSLKNFGDSAGTAVAAGIQRAQKEVAKSMKAAFEGGMGAAEISKSYRYLKELEKQLSQAHVRATGAYSTGMAKAEKAWYGMREKSLIRAMKKEREHIDLLARRRLDAARAVEDFRKKELHEQIDTYGQGIANVARTAISGDAQAMVGSLKDGGTSLMQRGRSMAAKGADDNASGTAKMLGSVGKAMAGIGASVAAIAAVAGAVTMLVKVLLDVEAVGKDINKTLLDAAPAASLGLGGAIKTADEVHDRLRMLSKATTDLSFAQEWYTDPKQLQGLLNVYAKAGMGVDRLTRGTNNATEATKKLHNSFEFALTYSKMFGTSVEEMAENQARLAFEQGTTLDRIAEGLSGVAEIARTSGFEVKRFYAAVLESTTGMGMYNVRIEQAAGLLQTLSTVLGETVAGDFLKSINASFDDMGFQERMKHMLLAGPDGVRQLMSEDAAREAGKVAQDIADALGGQTGVFEDLLGAKPEDFGKRLASMSRREFSRMESEAMMQGINTETLNQMRRAFDLAQGGKGDRSTMAMAQMDPTSKLMVRLREAEAIAGDLMSASDIDFAAAAEATGLSLKELEKLALLQNRMAGHFENLGDMAKAGVTSATANEQQAKFLEQLGVQIDEQGRIMSADGKRRIKNEEDLIKESKELGEIAKSQDVSEDIELAKSISQNTESVANVLKTQMLDVLLDIYDSTRGILDLLNLKFFKSLKGETKEERILMARAEAQSKLSGGKSAAEREIKRLEIANQDLAEAMAKASEEDQLSIKQRMIINDQHISKYQGVVDRNTKAMEAEEKLGGKYEKASDILRAIGGQGTSLGDIGTKTKETAKKALYGKGGGWYKDPSSVLSGAAESGDLLQSLKSQGLSDEQAKRVAEAGRSKAQRMVTQDFGGKLGDINDVTAVQDRFLGAMQEEIAAINGELGEPTLATADTVEAMRKQDDKYFREATGSFDKMVKQLSGPEQAKNVMQGLLGWEQAGALKKQLVDSGIDPETFAAQMGFGDFKNLATEYGFLPDASRKAIEELAQQPTQRDIPIEDGGGDFIVTKEGRVLKTAPDDNIVASRGGGGKTVHIHINGGRKQDVYETVRKAML